MGTLRAAHRRNLARVRLMVRVLLSAVVLAQPMGGVRRHSAELLPRVARLLREKGGALAVLEGREKIPFELPDFVERIPSSVPAHPVIARATLEGRALRRALEAATSAGARFDLVHTGHLPVPRHLKTPHCVTIHDLRALELEHTPLSRRLIARKVIGAAVEAAAMVITVSQHVREQLLARFRLHPDRVRVVPNAADHFIALPRAVGANAALLHVGHVERRKNLDVVVRALALDPTLPRLCLAGDAKHGEDERLRELARELGVLARVEFIGPFADERLAELLANAACMVLPSRLEGFGIPALEACRGRSGRGGRPGSRRRVAHRAVGPPRSPGARLGHRRRATSPTGPACRPLSSGPGRSCRARRLGAWGRRASAAWPTAPTTAAPLPEPQPREVPLRLPVSYALQVHNPAYYAS